MRASIVGRELGPLAGLRHPVGPMPGVAGRPTAPAAGASGSGSAWSRASARSTPNGSTRSWRTGPYRSLADVVERTGLPEEVIERLIRAGGARYPRAAPAGAPVAAPRGHGCERRADRRPDDADGRASLETGRRPADRPAPAGDPGAGPPADRRDRATRRRLRGDLARRPAPGHRSVPGIARAPRGGPELGAQRAPPSVRSGSVGWWSPGSIR